MSQSVCSLALVGLVAEVFLLLPCAAVGQQAPPPPAPFPAPPGQVMPPPPAPPAPTVQGGSRRARRQARHLIRRTGAQRRTGVPVRPTAPPAPTPLPPAGR
jgi:hypothetical protein